MHRTVQTLVYALYQKEENLHTLRRELLKRLEPNLTPQTWLILNQLHLIHWKCVVEKEVFSFFSPAFVHKIQEHTNLLKKYNDSKNPDYSLFVQQIPTWAYPPPEDIAENYEKLEENKCFTSPENKLLRPLLDCFEETWIGR